MFTVRPEKIRLGETSDSVGADECGAEGSVRDVVYVGVNTRYIVDLDIGPSLVVVQQNLHTTSTDALAAKGRRVKLIWNRQHNRALTGGELAEHQVEEVSA
jgi:putative spermidine/putrescine transport system ATP-binding protein